MELLPLLKEIVAKDGSDLHLKVKQVPIIRIHCELHKAGAKPLTSQDLLEVCDFLVPPHLKPRLEGRKETDFTFVTPDGHRFRTNLFWSRGDLSVVMRYVKKEVPNFAQLNLPATLPTLADVTQGITLIAGASGCGKSTTLAAIVQHLNEHHKYHIVTVEDPIEYVFEDCQSIINQREVGIDTESFSEALKYVLRQDPDVIVIGEMRDAESFLAALSAAETGHLVLSTLHTADASQSVNRILEFFNPGQREQIRLQLAQNLNAIICQKLLPRADGKGLVPAVEILMADTVVRRLIRENKLEKLPIVVERGTGAAQSFNRSLVELVKNNRITAEVALANASNPETLKLNLQGIFLDEEKGILNL